MEPDCDTRRDGDVTRVERNLSGRLVTVQDDTGKVIGVRVKDLQTNQEFNVDAKVSDCLSELNTFYPLDRLS